MSQDRDLVKEITDGRTGAFESLINRYQRLVVHIVHRMVLNIEDREDLCQEVFLRVYRSLTEFRFESRLSTWISRVAYNVCLSHLQGRRESLIDEHIPEIQSLDEIAGDAPPPDEQVAKRDVSRRLQAEVEHLPPVYRTVLTLFHLEQMSYREIGEIMNLPEGTVKSHLFRARRHLKARLLSRYRQEDLWS